MKKTLCLHDSRQSLAFKRSFSLSYWLGWLAQLTRAVDKRSLAAFGLPILIYLLTLAPTIYNLDSAELTTAANTGGLMRSTGYPLYLSMGYFWSRLPIGDVGYRMNLLSAVFAALTILLSERILRQLGVQAWATFGALGLLATSTFFWGLSLVAEVYTLQTALMTALILALLRWREAPSPSRIGVVALLAGLGLAHHASMTLLLPGSMFFMFVSHPRQMFKPYSIMAAVAGLLAGLLFYLYLPLQYQAQPSFNYAGIYDAGLNFHPVDLTSLDGIWWLVSGGAFRDAMLAYSPQELWEELLYFMGQLGQAFFAIGIAPGLLGAGLLFRRDWRMAGMLTLMFVFSAGFYINYRVLDKETMFLPVYLIWAIWLGYGYSRALDWLRQIHSATIQQTSLCSARLFIVGGALLSLGWNWHIVDLSDDWSTRQRGETIFSTVEPNALVFGWWDTAPPLHYLQLVEGQRADVQVVNRFLISPADLLIVLEKEVKTRPIYIDSLPTDLPLWLKGIPKGPLYQVVYSPETIR